MQLRGVLETALYAPDLDAAEEFYREVLGFELIRKRPGRHVFFRCGEGVFLLFNPEQTQIESTVGGALVPAHGSRGAGHVAFRVHEDELSAWRRRFESAGVEIESEVAWPQGGRSIYVRDPAGNSVELATPEIWGLSD